MVLEESQRELERGDPAPDFELLGTDGETHTLADFESYEALLVVFTCNHCPYAQARFEVLNALAADYDEVGVVGVNPNDADEYPEDSVDHMAELVEEGTIRYDAYLRDESQEVAQAYGAVCTPDPFLFREAQSASNGASDEGRSDGPQASAFELAYHGRLDDAQDPNATSSDESGFEMRETIDRVLAGDTVEREFRPSRGCSIKWS